MYYSTNFVVLSSDPCACRHGFLPQNAIYLNRLNTEVTSTKVLVIVDFHLIFEAFDLCLADIISLYPISTEVNIMRDANQKKVDTILCKKTVDAFEKRWIKGYYAENKEEALKIALKLIPEGSSVGYGGSMTLDEIGLKTALDNEHYHLIRRELAKTPEELREAYIRIYGADVFITSANAVTEDGIIVNIDGNGNRVSAISFGPKKVVFIVGVNKIAKDLDSAMHRARNTAAPVNCARLSLDTPCQTAGSCVNCLNPKTICSEFLVTRCNKLPDRMHVIVVNEELGY